MNHVQGTKNYASSHACQVSELSQLLRTAESFHGRNLLPKSQPIVTVKQ